MLWIQQFVGAGGLGELVRQASAQRAVAAAPSLPHAADVSRCALRQLQQLNLSALLSAHEATRHRSVGSRHADHVTNAERFSTPRSSGALGVKLPGRHPQHANVRPNRGRGRERHRALEHQPLNGQAADQRRLDLLVEPETAAAQVLQPPRENVRIVAWH